MMRKVLFLTVLLFSLAGVMRSQQLSVKSFKLAEGDISARTDSCPDANGGYCALIKVGVALDGVQFTNGVLKVVHKPGEYWVYLAKNISALGIYHNSYTPLTVNFYDYGIGRVEAGTTYIMTLEKPQNYIEPVDAGGNFYALTVQPKDAKVTVDNVLQQSSSDGEYSAMLPYGSHSYRVEAGGYISQSGTFTVSSGEMQPITVRLQSAMATLSVSCPTPAVSLYVDKKSVGGTPWTGSLKEGMHLLEVKKEGYRSQQKTVNLAQQQKLDISFGELSAILGNLSVNYKPFGADVYLDGKKIGQSPRVFNGIVIGNHRVEIKKDGYTSDNKTINVSEGQTASVSGSLSSAFSYSNSSSSSSLSSGSNIISIPVKNGISIDMVRVEAGTFMMGGNDENPVHQVTLTNDYYIGKYEVTQALWKTVMDSNPSCFKGDNLPVETVSWDDCQTFINKLNRLTGKRFRLPTEAEWEYAARGGRKSKGYQFSGGGWWTLLDCLWCFDNSERKTHPVGQKKSNELGIHDMSGNVWEWCSDWSAPYSTSPQINPTGPVIGNVRVCRGGSFSNTDRWCRLVFRYNHATNYRGNNFGLRLVLSE